MRLALTYNLRRTEQEDEAEFDTAKTIRALTKILVSLGHVVTPVDVSGPIGRLIARLRRLSPDLVFNLAEGHHGRFREAFYPALLEQLGVPHTGSTASVLALCLDKELAKRVVAAAGVCVPRGSLVQHASDLADLDACALPAIVKPNYEGSSKGITQASVVEDVASLRRVALDVLERYPEGVLVEEYLDGTDVAVAYVDGLGVLVPIGYAYEALGPHRILELALKQGPSDRVRVEVPASLRDDVSARLVDAATRAFSALGVRSYGRADFRITPDGRVVFLEMNPLPTLADEDLWVAAAWMGTTRRELVAHILGAGSSGPRLEPCPA